MSFLLHSTHTAHTFLKIKVVPVHTIKTYGSGVFLHTFLILALYTLAALPTAEIALGLHWIGGQVACKASLDAL